MWDFSGYAMRRLAGSTAAELGPVYGTGVFQGICVGAGCGEDGDDHSRQGDGAARSGRAGRSGEDKEETPAR